MLWDQGKYYVYGEKPLESLSKGRLHLVLDGKKAKGEWALIRIRSEGEKNQWLLLKATQSVKPLSKKLDDQSVKSGRTMKQIADERDALARTRDLYVYYPGTSVVSNKIAARVLNRPHSITATVELANGAEGVLVAQGGSSGGYALYVKDHKLHYAYNFLGIQQYHLASDATLSDGRHELRFEFEPTGKPDLAHGKGTPARAQLYVDGKLAGQTDLPVTIPLDIGITDGLTCGRDDGSTVTTDYQAPFAFSGALEKVVVDVSGDLIEDHDARL